MEARQQEQHWVPMFWKIQFGLNYLALLVVASLCSANWEDFTLLSMAAVFFAMFMGFVTGMFTIVFVEPLYPVLRQLLRVLSTLAFLLVNLAKGTVRFVLKKCCAR